LVAVFQPHLYSRTRLLAREFGRALARADAAVVLDVYAARERAAEHPGVSGLAIAEAAAEQAGGRAVYWLPSFADAAPVLEGLLGEGDVCVVMGAGDVDALARALVDTEAGVSSSLAPANVPGRGSRTEVEKRGRWIARSPAGSEAAASTLRERARRRAPSALDPGEARPTHAPRAAARPGRSTSQSSTCCARLARCSAVSRSPGPSWAPTGACASRCW